MVRRKSANDTPSHGDEGAFTTPVPPAKLHITLTELPAGKPLHRVHQGKYQAAQFNPGVQGNARFSPILDQHGKAIPTLYAGTTLAHALMETVFHTVEITQPILQENNMPTNKKAVLASNPDQIIKDLLFTGRDQDAIHKRSNLTKQLEVQERLKLETLRRTISRGLMDLGQGCVIEVDGEQLEHLLANISGRMV